MSAQPPRPAVPRVTAASLAALKESGRPIVVITAYDHPGARIAEAAGVDAILVGDSLGMTVLGRASTLPVTMDEMVYHTAAVASACKRCLVIGDMPFMSYQADIAEGMHNAARFLAEAGAHAVKLEGATERTLSLVRNLVEAGIPVMGHLGLTPQSVNVFGGYRTQAKDAEAAAKLLSDCVALQEAGAFAIVLECVPAELARRASELLAIPTIGIGAGAGCDGQVQVFHDVLGLGEILPRHARRYADIGEAMRTAIEAYSNDVRDGAFPAEENLTHADEQVVAQAELIYAGGTAS